MARGTLTTSEIVDVPAVPNSSVEARFRMNSAESFHPRYPSNPSQQSAADDAWRAEVASRVSTYRARKKKVDDSALALDFGPVSESADVAIEKLAAKLPIPQNLGSQSFGAQSLGSQGLGSQDYSVLGRVTLQGGRSRTQPAAPASHNAFDTNYYRRLNAAAMSQCSNLTIGATATATVVVPELEAEPEPQPEAESAVACEESIDDLVLDLEIRPNAAANLAPSAALTAGEDTCLDRYRISEPEPEIVAEPEPVASPQPPAAQGNLIVFRRPVIEPPLAPQPCRDELAEPMSYRPRILEVPEDIMPAVQGSLFPEIRLDADEQETSSSREPEIQVPLRVSMISERLMASLTDMVIVAAGSLIFGGIAWQVLPEIPHTKPFFMVLGAVTMLLWAVYQHMFLLYAGRTPGMKSRGIRLSTFNGRIPRWKQRVSRARFMCISFASVSLGFLWALVDEDELCWHDRISQTFPTAE
jgi:uncharacterized RDD family membrane protein YckC